MDEFSFPLEKTRSMNILGKITTGAIPGQVLVAALIFISTYFLTRMNFNLISLLIFFGLFLPLGFFIHFRLVVRGRKLMRVSCTVQYEQDTGILKYQSGFPNTMELHTNKLEITDENRDLTIRGSELSGYQICVGKGRGSEAIRLGAWLNFQEAHDAAEGLKESLGGKLQIDISEPITENHA